MAAPRAALPCSRPARNSLYIGQQPDSGPIPAHWRTDMAVATAKKTGNGKPGAKHNIEAMREAYYERISKYDMAPLWKVMNSVVTKEPVTHCVPAIWRFQDAKALVLESGPLITAEEAERRVLVLENPAMRGQSKITNSL